MRADRPAPALQCVGAKAPTHVAPFASDRAAAGASIEPAIDHALGAAWPEAGFQSARAVFVAAKRIIEPAVEPTGNVVAITAAGRPPSVDDDGDLLAACAAGDGAAFRELMARHLSVVLACARRITASQAEAEDVAQETFLRLWHGAGELTAPPGGLRAWLRRVAANLAIDHLRRSKRFDVTDEVPEQEVAADQLDGLAAADLSRRVEAALDGLPERQRVAIGLFHFEELSQREVADAMSISEDALESLLARGRRRLRQLLEADMAELLGDG